MATTTLGSPATRRAPLRSKSVAHALTRARFALRSAHPAWLLSLVLLLYIVLTTVYTWDAFDPTKIRDRPDDIDLPSAGTSIDEGGSVSKHSGSSNAGNPNADDNIMRARAARAHASNFSATGGAFRGRDIGNHFCILQPTLSAGLSRWTENDARNHIAIRAFMRTFADTVTPSERERFKFSIYYGHDSDDAVFGVSSLRKAFASAARRMLAAGGFLDDDVKLVFTPMYGLHGRLNAIWNILAKDAYYDGCDYFFLSNDDMVFFTRGWVTRAVDSLNGIGAPLGHKRPCRGFGIVRFKDEWANWATFTFHVSTRIHLEIFGGVYYPVPYHAAHNDYWINFVYRAFEASKYRGEVKVRNRVDDVDFALAHQKDTQHIAPPRYTYDKRGHARQYIHQGIVRVKQWLDRYKNTERCQPPL